MGYLRYFVIPLSHMCGSSRGYLRFHNSRKLQICREDREGTALTAIEAYTYRKTTSCCLPPTKIFCSFKENGG